MTSTWRPVLALVMNAAVFGLSWWPLREMQARGLHPLWATALMFGLSYVFISAYKPQAWRGLLRHPALWWLFVASGVTNFGFNWAVTLGDVVRVVLLFYTMPAWAVVLAWWLLGERPSRGGLLRLLLALLGVALVLKTPDMDWPWPASLLDYLALLGGASFALVNVLLRKLADVSDSERTSAMFGGGMLVTTLAAAIGVPLGVVSVPADLSWWPYAFGFAMVLLAANACLQYGAARLPASTTALVMLSEILFATLSSVGLGASELSERKLLGGALIVVAAFLATMPHPSKDPPL